MTGIFVILLGVVLLVAMAARRRVAAVCQAGKGVYLKREKTGAEVALAMLEAGGLEENVRVIEQRGMLPDAYDASKRVVYLKSENYHGTGATAVGVAAHETAHALQHRDSFTALSFRMSAIKLSQVVSGLVLVGAIAGAFLLKYPGRVALMIIAGSWVVFMVMNLMTLPVEFEASKRAKRLMKKLGVLANRDEGEAVGKVLTVMALANVGAILGSIPYLVYHLLPGFGRKGAEGKAAVPEAPVAPKAVVEKSASEADRQVAGSKARVIDVEPEIIVEDPDEKRG